MTEWTLNRVGGTNIAATRSPLEHRYTLNATARIIVALLGFCSLAFAIVMDLFALNEARRFAQVRRRGINAMAEVVRIHTYRSGTTGKADRYPVVRFVTTGSETVTTELRWTKMRDSAVGNRFEIRYLPERPKVINLWDGGFPYSSTFWPVIGSILFIAIGARLLS